MSGFCRWYGKDMEDVTEHEQEQCEENGQDCRECPDSDFDGTDLQEQISDNRYIAAEWRESTEKH